MLFIAENLSCVRGGRKIFEGVSLSLRTGESLLLKGPNGVGKTSLLRTLAGFIPPFEGGIDISETDESDLEIAELCHYVGHLNGVKLGFSVEENALFYNRYLGDSDPEKVDLALRTFHLDPIREMPADILSAGQKRKLGLTRLIAAHRPIWVLDEPSVSLDTASVEILASVVSNHVDEGGIVIAATHVSLGIEFTHTIQMTPGN